MSGRPLTKSRFKIALECPTKLYYSSHKEYYNKKVDDEFLKALARGGFQVGELAKAYYPGGIEIQTLDKAEALRLTNEHLQKDQVVLFEAAVAVENFLIRVDILVKNKNSIHLIEVKAKSYDPLKNESFFTKPSLKKGPLKISADWSEYLHDIAFQKQVAQLAFPKANITTSLMLADKSKVATVDGLNQMFLLTKSKNGQTEAVRVGQSDLGAKILCEVNVDQEVNHILSDAQFLPKIRHWGELSKKDQKQATQISSHCKGCEFQTSHNEPQQKNGFQECWEVPTKEVPVLQIWNYRKTDVLLAEGKKYISQVTEEDINPQDNKKSTGLSSSQRQWQQVLHIQQGLKAPYIDHSGLSEAMQAFQYPLNCIDFETSMSALPFHKGRRPYEQVAFQFSHHILYADGRVVHAGEFIHREVGTFPNFEFVRALKRSLSQNSGTIFRYSNHENTVLLQIYDQLQFCKEPDREELCQWISTITKKKDKETDELVWEGPRNMIDLYDLVKRFYYHPKTKGSNSIKYVLPAVISESAHVRKKFSEWMQYDEAGAAKDPYKLLPPLVQGYENDQIEDMLFQGDDIKDGGAASTAYAMMQFTQMSQVERDILTAALLKYCHLDTLAMVMLVEHWLEVLGKIKKVG